MVEHGDGIEIEIVVDAEEELVKRIHVKLYKQDLSRIDLIAVGPPISTGEEEADVQR
jgi:hypothetical protein